MKKVIIFVILAIILVSIGFYLGSQFNKRSLNPFIEKTFKTYSLKNYSFANLRKQEFLSNTIELENKITETDTFVSYRYYSFDNNKRISGLINIPKQPGTYPIVILLRGYVDKETYSIGIGSQRIGEFLVQNNFVTIAPDFLGYGKSDKASADSMEERFQTYTTVLELLASLKNLDEALINKEINSKVDLDRIFIWAHSNGGHIALSTLAITQKNYPTVLWAPVSKPFPYSILYFTDEYSDNGKYLRKTIADFEESYDIEKYNPVNYYKWIKAPIQIHQGINDDSVPLSWSTQLDKKLQDLETEVEYFVYENADHNLMPNGWSAAAQRTLDFYKAN